MLTAAAGTSFAAAAGLLAWPAPAQPLPPAATAAAAVSPAKPAATGAPAAAYAAQHPAQPPQRPGTVTVRAGDTLTWLAARFMGAAADWPALYMANQALIGGNPDELRAGTVLTIPGRVSYWLRRWRALQAATAARTASHPAAVAVAEVTPVAAGSGVLSAAQVGQLWLSAGGPASAEATAECIAWHESGDRTDVLSPSDDEGLFQINVSNAPTGEMENPAANAAEAVRLFDRDGWSPWTTRGDCGA